MTPCAPFLRRLEGLEDLDDMRRVISTFKADEELFAAVMG